MGHYAEVIDGIVTKVIVAKKEFIDSGAVGDPSTWIKTSYNTIGGVHTQGGTPLRKNYAGVGYTYDSVRDAFIPPRIYNSWVLNENTCQWDPPVPHPNDGNIYLWDEDNIKWILQS